MAITKIGNATLKGNETNLVANWYKKKYYDFLKIFENSKGLRYAIRENLLVGKGVENVSFGLIKPEDYKDTGNPYVDPTATPQDLVEKIETSTKIIYPFAADKLKMLPYFESMETFNEYFNKQMEFVNKSIAENNVEFYEAFFKIAPRLDSLTTEQKTAIEKERAKLWVTANKTDIHKGAESDNNVVLLKMVEAIIEQTIKFKKPDVKNSASQNYPASASAGDLILVMGRSDYRNYKKALTKLTNYRDLYDLDNLGFYDIYLSNDLSNVAYLYDKDAIQIYPQFREITNFQNPKTLKTIKFYHFWNRFGVLTNAASHYFEIVA